MAQCYKCKKNQASSWFNKKQYCQTCYNLVKSSGKKGRVPYSKYNKEHHIIPNIYK